MIEILNREECCGCEACVQVCPKGCISMVRDAEGFLYPKVDESACINCGACDRACPEKNVERDRNREILDAYGAYVKSDDIRNESSSGGIFSAVAESIIADGGIVYGAAYVNDFKIKHIKAENLEELSRLRSSKYAQSTMEGAFKEIKAELLKGRKVLFSGTECQIEGLRGYLGKSYENLYLVDVLCHGVPSPGVFAQYVEHLKKKYAKKIADIRFRDKCSGWRGYSFSIKFGDKTKECKLYRDNDYMKLFLRNMILRPSCHSCQFKDINRKSDITLGDFWSVDSIMPEMNDDKGVSIMLLHSEKGRALFDAIKDKLEVKKIDDPDTALPPGNDARVPVKKSIHREFFFKLYGNKNISWKNKMIIYKLRKKVFQILKKG